MKIIQSVESWFRLYDKWTVQIYSCLVSHVTNVILINSRSRVSRAINAKNRRRKCALLDLYFLSKVGLMTSRCNKEMHTAGKSNLEDDQVIYDRRIVLFLSSFLDLPLSTFSRLSFFLILFVSTAHGHSRRTRYPSKRRAGCCWWDEYQVATSHSPFIPVTRSRSRERRQTTICTSTAAARRI